MADAFRSLASISFGNIPDLHAYILFSPAYIRCPAKPGKQDRSRAAPAGRTVRVSYVAKKGILKDSGCPLVFTSDRWEAEPLLTWRLLLFPFQPFLFLLLLCGR
jgi:hypothetical protein